jgi:glycosyltransferase involved in cell wall biosynthesis
MSAAPGEAIRVLFVCHFYPPHVGGIENVVHQEATRLAASGAQVTVLTSGERGGVTVESGVTVVRVRAWNGFEQRAGVPFPLFGPALAARALRWTRWADVVHVHDSFYLTSWAAWLASVLTGTPMVMTQHVRMVEHSSGVVRLVQRLVYATAGRLLMRRARLVFTMNAEVASFAAALGARSDAVRHLPNGVDTELFRPPRDSAERDRERARLGLPADGVLVLFVGRFVPKKGFDLLLDAADPAYLLVFAGSGEDTTLKARSDVRLLGSLTPAQVAAAYRACDVFALPSASEGFPLTVQEAMSSGLAVVTSDDPGYRSYGLDRDRVSLVPRDIAALRKRLTEIALDPGLREDMGRYARAYAQKRFAWPEHVATLSEAYRSACGRR